MTATPFLSVVVPSFDRVDVLPRAIASIRAQSFDDFELLIVDDGSTDGTADLVTGLEDPRIHLVEQPRRGVSAARNLGLSRARGEVVTFLDSDDEALPEWLGSFAAGFADPAVGIVTAGVRMRDPAGDEDVVLPARLSPLYGDHRLCFLAGALAVRRTLLAQIGGYAPDLAYAENEELAIRLVPACLAAGLTIRSLDRPLVVYHRDPTPWRQDPARFARIRSGAEYILERHGDRLRRLFPRGYANHCGVAAVNAARLGDLTAARRHLAAALRATPFRWKYWGRWAITLAPPLARRFWNRRRPEVIARDVAGARR